MSNTVQLKGEALFQHLVRHYKMSTSGALNDLKSRGICLGWLDGLSKGVRTALEVDDPFITAYIRGEEDGKV